MPSNTKIFVSRYRYILVSYNTLSFQILTWRLWCPISFGVLYLYIHDVFGILMLKNGGEYAQCVAEVESRGDAHKFNFINFFFVYSFFCVKTVQHYIYFWLFFFRPTNEIHFKCTNRTHICVRPQTGFHILSATIRALLWSVVNNFHQQRVLLL